MVIVGPVSFFLRGLSSRITRAVMTLATLAAGIACSLPELPINPRLWTPTAAEPRLGQGMAGAGPASNPLYGRLTLGFVTLVPLMTGVHAITVSVPPRTIPLFPR